MNLRSSLCLLRIIFILKWTKEYKKYSEIGKRWLENRVIKLFSEDGCFSQYSVNYHRMVMIHIPFVNFIDIEII